jgi:hypothetical protein
MKSMRFTPSRVDGLPDVSEVVVLPDRVELQSRDTRHVLRFHDIARWPAPRLLWRFLFFMGWRRAFIPVADRDWCRTPRDRYFSFYSQPRIVVYMPDDESDGYGDSVFYQMRSVMESAGFRSFDLA